MSNFHGIHHDGDAPPQDDNPLLAAYENYRRETPAITRNIMTTQAVSFFMSFFIDLNPFLANIPFLTVVRLEVYRIFTSFLVSTGGFISLVFAYLSFVPMGKRLEQSMGSTEFLCLFVTIGVLTNVIYTGLTYFLDALMGFDKEWRLLPSSGLWNVLFGVISMECTKAPEGALRKIFLFTVPAKYYPLALGGFFAFLGSFSLSHLISIGLGYGFGYGYLDVLRISSIRSQSWEEQYLRNWIGHDRNWIASSFAVGSGAWSEEMETSQVRNRNNVGLSALLSRWRSPTQQPQETGGYGIAMGFDDIPVAGTPRHGRIIKNPASTNQNETAMGMPTTGGQRLGSDSRMSGADPRQARLQALERRLPSNKA